MALLLVLSLSCDTAVDDDTCDDPQWLTAQSTSVSRSTHEPVFCWVEMAGTLRCWPDELQEQAGFPTGIFTTVSVGDDHICAVREGGEAACWGWGDCAWGECDSPEGEFIYIRSGIDVNCGETIDGTVHCWGRELDLG